jgi:hypothetical protein
MSFSQYQTVSDHRASWEKKRNRNKPEPSEISIFWWVWWYRSVILALGRLRQEDMEFEISLGYVVRSCLKTKHTNTQIRWKGWMGRHLWDDGNNITQEWHLVFIIECPNYVDFSQVSIPDFSYDWRRVS